MKMESSVEVDADPETAFHAFTDEMDRWWGNGPIDAWDYSRTIGRRIEPGVGGRVLEVYQDDVLELARITAWEPGRGLSWKSSIDDVTIHVRFEAVGGRTRVRVEGEMPDGEGARGAGLAILRMTPQWLPRYFGRGRRPWLSPDRLMVLARYEHPAGTARWLCEAFAFEPTSDIPDDETNVSWIELRLGTSVVVIQGGGGPVTGQSDHEVFLLVDDVNEHLARAERAGATIVQPIKTYGFTSYVADDPEGRRWNFVQANLAGRGPGPGC
jgi:uncharacterized glyoxalase superfamily protein PhnB/uncharacterized protein YndB with AHSA1/START domain